MSSLYVEVVSKHEKQQSPDKQTKNVKQVKQVKKDLKQVIVLNDKLGQKSSNGDQKRKQNGQIDNKPKIKHLSKQNGFKGRGETMQIDTSIPNVLSMKKQTILSQDNQLTEQNQHSKNTSTIVVDNKRSQKFQSKLIQINSNISKLNSSLRDIKQNYDEIEKITEQELLFKKNDRKKQRQIRDFLLQKRIEKESRQKRLKQIRQRESLIVQKVIEQTAQRRRRQRQQQIQRIKQKDYIVPRQRHLKYLQQQQQGIQLAQALLQRYKLTQPIHIRKQREFQQIQQKKKQQQLQILMQRKHRYQSLDLEQLEEHKRQYQERKEEIENARRQEREMMRNKIQEDNIVMRDMLWKGPAHDLVDEELAERSKKKKQPKEKAKRIKNYQQFIRHNFLPKTHPPNKRSHSIDIHDYRISQSLGNYSGRYQMPSNNDLLQYDPRKKHVKKYRFFQGNAIGSVLQSIPVARSYSQQKKIGQSYLQYLKRLPKKQPNTQTQIDLVDLQMISKKFNTIAKVKRQAVPFYEKSTKNRTVSLSQKPTKQQVKMVYEQLKNHDFKLKSKRQLIKVMKQNSPGSMDMQKQVNSGLILNMQRKLDLLSKL